MSEQNIWDKLYETKLALEKSNNIVDCVIIHPYCYEVNLLPERYKKLGYPLGKNMRGWKKWLKRKLNSLDELKNKDYSNYKIVKNNSYKITKK